jgi:hypothetical protein
MDRSLRAEFLLRRRRRSGATPGPDGGSSRSPQGASWGGPRSAPSPVDEFNASIRRGRRAKAHRAGRFYAEEEEAEAEAAAEWHRRRRRAAESKSMAPGAAGEGDDWDLERALSMLDGGLLGKLQQDFDEALLFAYMGPRVEEGQCVGGVLVGWSGVMIGTSPLTRPIISTPTLAQSIPIQSNHIKTNPSIQSNPIQAPSPGPSSARSGGPSTTKTKATAPFPLPPPLPPHPTRHSRPAPACCTRTSSS